MNLVIIFLFIFLVVFIINKKSSFKSESVYNDIGLNELSSKLYNGDKYDGYRLADVIFYPDYLTREHKYSTMSHLYKYPDTIGVEYIRRKYPFLKKINSENDFSKYQNEYSNFENTINSNINSTKIDIDLLNDIIKEKNKEEQYFNEDTLYLHVRVGDVLCKYPGQNHSLIYSKRGDTGWWESVMDYIKNKGITKVVIIAGTHFKDCLMESAEYLQEIKKKLTSEGLNVFYRIGNSPDDDLMFCRNAKHFITTGGGYGYFLGKIVELNGGNFVLNKKDTVRKDRALFG